MKRWLWWSPFALFAVCAAVLGLRQGYLVVAISETDVINRYAQQYLQDRARDGTEDGAALTDCVAYPGAGRGIWLHIVCGPDGVDASRSYEYEVDRAGRFVRGWSPHSEGLIPGAGGGPST